MAIASDDSKLHMSEENRDIDGLERPPLDKGLDDDTKIQPLTLESESTSNHSLSSRKEAGFGEVSTPLAILGSGSSRLSDFVNEHLIAVRFASSASILLLTAYGVAHTPLFFRYRTVAELTPSHFINRKRLACRLIKADKDPKQRDVVLWMRHLSPLERICWRKSWFEWVVKMQPSSIIRQHADQDPSQLLKVVLAGVQHPPYHLDDGWIDQLVQDKTPVMCTCLARRVSSDSDGISGNSPWTATTARRVGSDPIKRTKRPIPELTRQTQSDLDSLEQEAVCTISFRPTDSSRLWLWRLMRPEDLAMSMVQSGRAVTTEGSLYGRAPVLHKSEAIKDLQQDAAYLNQLSRMENHAASGFRGIWSDPSYRESRSEDMEFQASATVLKRLWRWIRGG